MSPSSSFIIAHKGLVFVESKLIEEWFSDLIDVANDDTWEKNLRREFEDFVEQFLSAWHFQSFSINKTNQH